MTKIRVLPSALADKIAAGEVIERPASVVKELIENSIDAGSNHISIEISGGGIKKIKVTDDGCGISPDEVLLAFERHATSKIQNQEDLLNIATLGFRGEALPSIAAVATVEMKTKRSTDTLGSYIKISGGRVEFIKETGCNPGTEITVSDIFFNTPARLKYLKKPAQELIYIDDVITRIAIAYPNIYFTFSSDGKLKFQSPSYPNLENRLADIYGLKTIEKMIPLQNNAPKMHIYGFISKPELSRGNRNNQTFFVNGRWVKSSLLNAAVDHAYKTLLPTGRFPVLVLNLCLPPDTIDVNVHPAKTEVRLPDERTVFNFISTSIKQELSKHMLSPLFELDKSGEEHVENEKKEPGQQLPLNIKIAEKVYESQQTGEYFNHKKEKISSAIPLESLEVQNTVFIPKAHVFNTYVIAEGPDGIYIIDQHAAHERILYERLLKKNGPAAGAQQLLSPAVIEVTPVEKQFLLDNILLFNEVGFNIEEFGTNTIIIRAVPLVFRKSLDEKFLIDFFDEIINRYETAVKPDNYKQKIIITMACKAAVKANDRLSQSEMEQLVIDLFKTENPYTCPHGRPTIIILTHSELLRKFKRV